MPQACHITLIHLAFFWEKNVAEGTITRANSLLCMILSDCHEVNKTLRPINLCMKLASHSFKSNDLIIFCKLY